MDDLPEVALRKVFAFLSIPGRFRARATCKKWKFVIDNSPKSLCIYHESYPCKEKWRFSGQKVLENEMVELNVDRENGCRFDLRGAFFRNLQKVYLYHSDEAVDRFFEQLSQFTRLKTLMIKGGRMKFKTLSSSGLEQLFLESDGFDELELATPNLSSLILWIHPETGQNQSVKFLFPLKPKHLECLQFSANLSQLKNLETLVCQEITFDFSLNDFKSLRKLEVWSFDAFRTAQQQRRRLKRKNLEMIASGFEEKVVAFSTQEHCFCRRENHRCELRLSPPYLAMVEKNWSRLVGSTPWKFEISLTNLVRHADRVPREFFDKFRIEKIEGDDLAEELGQIEQSNLTELLKRASPSRLLLRNLRLKPEFAEQLSCIKSIKRVSGVAGLKGLHYLLHLTYLEQIVSNFETISIDFLCKMVKELKFFKHFQLHSMTEDFHLYITLYKRSEHHGVLLQEKKGCPFSFSYYYGILEVSKHFELADELVQEIKRMKENDLIQRFLV